MAWQLTTPGLLYDREEPTAVYYHSGSGNTHLLSSFSLLVVRLLSQQPMNLADLGSALAPHVAEEDFNDISAAIPEILDNLVELDILETCV